MRDRAATHEETGARGVSRRGTRDAAIACAMTDVVVLAVTLALYGACAAFVRFCDRI